MDRLDSAQNTPQDAEQIDEEILADNDPSTEEGAASQESTFNAQSPAPADPAEQ